MEITEVFCFVLFKKNKQLVISTGTGRLLISRKSIELLPNNRQSTPPADRIQENTVCK